jgi:4-amino-4-deoxy-L-arabinose transferase-like glycosyltransferase
MRLRIERTAIPGAIVTLISLIVAALVFGRFLVPYAVPVGFDEGYMVSFAERVIDGRWLPYVDGVSHRGPALYWILSVAQLLTGRFQWAGIRWVGLGGCLTTVLATFLAGVAARRPLAGAIGGAAYVFALATQYAPGSGIGVHGEPVATPFLALALCLVAFALHRTPSARRRLGLLALAGASLAVGNMTKQTTAMTLPAFLLWVLAWEPADGVPARALARLRPVGCFIAGWGLPFLALLLWYAAHGALHELVYWSLTYNTNVYMQPYSDVWRAVGNWFLDQPYVLVGVALTAMVAVARPLSRVDSWTPRGLARAYAATGFETTAALMGLLLLLTAALPLRFWPHYFIPVYPFLGIALGVLVEQLVGGPEQPLARQLPVGLVAAALLIICGSQRLADLQQQRARGGWGNPRPDAICAEVDKYARPREPIFVWGFDGDLYITCRHPAAARFTYVTMVAGVVPPFWTDRRPARVAPGARATLRRDLEQSRPPVILDVPLYGFSMTAVPELKELLDRDYCPLPGVKGNGGRAPQFFGRRDRGLCADPPRAR